MKKKIFVSAFLVLVLIMSFTLTASAATYSLGSWRYNFKSSNSTTVGYGYKLSDQNNYFRKLSDSSSTQRTYQHRILNSSGNALTSYTNCLGGNGEYPSNTAYYGTLRLQFYNYHCYGSSVKISGQFYGI